MLRQIYRVIQFCFPKPFRQEFNEEIMADLIDLEKDIKQCKPLQKLSLIRREIIGWFKSIIREQAHEIKRRFQQDFRDLQTIPSSEMELEMEKETSTDWNIEGKKEALVASLPPFILGTAIWVTWLIIGGPWYTASETQLNAGLYTGLALAGLIALGGIVALFKRFPAWGYAWLGSDIIGTLLLLKSLAEEEPMLIPQWIIAVIFSTMLVFCAVVFIHAILKCWQAAGLISIGMSTTLALSTVYTMAIGPYHRVDLAILGLVCGLAFSLLVYGYVRSAQPMQISLLCMVSLLGIGLLIAANQVWAVQLAEMGKGSPLVPMLVILMILLLSGPLAGLFQKPVDTIFGRYFKS